MVRRQPPRHSSATPAHARMTASIRIELPPLAHGTTASVAWGHSLSIRLSIRPPAAPPPPRHSRSRPPPRPRLPSATRDRPARRAPWAAAAAQGPTPARAPAAPGCRMPRDRRLWPGLTAAPQPPIGPWAAQRRVPSVYRSLRSLESPAPGGQGGGSFRARDAARNLESRWGAHNRRSGPVGCGATRRALWTHAAEPASSRQA